MRLAAIVGRVDVDGMLAEISAEQLSEWAAFFEIEPHGPARGDLQAGVIASQVANLFRRKGDPAANPADFLLKFGKPKSAALSAAEREQRIRDALMGFVERGRLRREQEKNR